MDAMLSMQPLLLTRFAQDAEQDDGDSQRDNYSPRRAIDSDMRAVLPTRTLASIMRDLGHEGNITVLKLDVRGSNMGFLSQAIDQLGAESSRSTNNCLSSGVCISSPLTTL